MSDIERAFTIWRVVAARSILVSSGGTEHMNNREKLINLMIDHELERRELAELVLVDKQTVDNWLASPESARSREIPDMAIELLGFKLGLIPTADDDSAANDTDAG